MATPFQIFVNGELPKRPFTQDAAVSWTPGRVLVTTGVALGVTTDEFPAPPVTSVNSSTGAVVITADSLSAIPTSQKGAASGVASLDASGFVPMSQMNPGVVERLYVVTDETARFALTTSQVQNGDVVKQELPAPAAMYYVQDDTNLDSELGYAVFAVGTAAAVAWSGVTGIPQVLLDLENISGAVTGDILQFDGLNWIKQSRDTYVTGLDLQTSDIEGLDTALGEKQVHDVTLDALSNLPDLGFIVQIAEDSFTSRSLEAGDGITITYPDGVDGNPLIAFAEGPSEAAGTHGDENTYLGLDIDSHGRTTLVTQLRLRKDTVYIPNSTDSLTLEAKTLYMIGDYVTNTYGELNLQLPILTTEALIEIQVAFTVQSISQVNLTPNGVDLVFGQSASVDINTVLPPLLPGCVLRLFYHSVGLGWVASVLYSDNVSSLHVHQTNSTSFTNKHVITSDATEYRTLSIPDANLSLGDVITQLTFDRDTDVLTGLRSDTTEVTTLFNQGYLDELFNPDGVSLSTPLKVGRTYRSSGTIQVHPVETPVYLPAATADAFNSHESMPIKIIMRDDVLDSGYLHLTPQFGDDLMYATVSGVVSSGGNEVPIPNHSVVTCYMVQAGTWYVEVKQDSTYLDTDHFSVVDPLDRTKSVKLNVAPVSTDTQRVITIPDSDVSLGKIPTGTAPVFSSGKLMVPLADGTSIPLSTFGGTHLTGPNTPETQLAPNGHYFFYVDTGSQYAGTRQLSLPESPADLTYIRLSNLCSVSAFATGAGATITPGGTDKINGLAETLSITDYLVNYRSAVITFTYSSSSANWTVSVLGDLIKPGTVAIYDADKTNTTTLTPVTDLTTNRVITLPDANVDLGKVLSSISYAPTTGVITITNVDATTIATTNTGVIADDMLRIQATGAATKKMGFNCSAVTAGQTRIVTMPDTNVDLGKVLSSISYAPTTGVITLTNVDASTFATTNIGAIADDMLRIQATGAATKKMGFNCSAVTAGQTRIVTMPDANVDLSNGTSSTVASGAFVYATGMGSVVKTITGNSTTFNVDALEQNPAHSVTIRNGDSSYPYNTPHTFQFVSAKVGTASGFADAQGFGLQDATYINSLSTLTITLQPNESMEVRYLGSGGGFTSIFSMQRNLVGLVAIPASTSDFTLYHERRHSLPHAYAGVLNLKLPITYRVGTSITLEDVVGTSSSTITALNITAANSQTVQSVSSVNIKDLIANGCTVKLVFSGSNNWVMNVQYTPLLRYVINSQALATTYAIASTDVSPYGNKILNCTNSSVGTVTIGTPASLSATTGDSLTIRQAGLGSVTVTGPITGPAVTIAQYSTLTLIAGSTSTWISIGG